MHNNKVDAKPHRDKKSRQRHNQTNKQKKILTHNNPFIPGNLKITSFTTCRCWLHSQVLIDA